MTVACQCGDRRDNESNPDEAHLFLLFSEGCQEHLMDAVAVLWRRQERQETIHGRFLRLGKWSDIIFLFSIRPPPLFGSTRPTRLRVSEWRRAIDVTTVSANEARRDASNHFEPNEL